MDFQALPHECIILDACCAINLFHSGLMTEIVGITGKRIAIASYVFESELLSVDLQPLVDGSVISVVRPVTQAEEIAIVDFAQIVDDGEAYTAAIAEQNGWAIASDDSKATLLFAARLPQLQVVTTLDFIHYWATTKRVSQQTVYDALEGIRINGRYSPGSKHTHYGWWRSHFP